MGPENGPDNIPWDTEGKRDACQSSAIDKVAQLRTSRTTDTLPPSPAPGARPLPRARGVEGAARGGRAARPAALGRLLGRQRLALRLGTARLQFGGTVRRRGAEQARESRHGGESDRRTSPGEGQGRGNDLRHHQAALRRRWRWRDGQGDGLRRPTATAGGRTPPDGELSHDGAIELERRHAGESTQRGDRDAPTVPREEEDGHAQAGTVSRLNRGS